ncbi:MAG TPA: hypothetical protein VJC03_02510, partial [bacterium]|nr:hypothetical protein [bacterium]
MISFYRLKAQIIFNKLRNLSAAGRAGRILLLFLGAGSFYGIYHVFLRIFVYLNQLPLFGYYLIFRLFSFLFLVFLIMVPLSALLNSFSLFFSSRDIPFLMLLPVPSGGIFSLKYSELLYHTLWMPGLILLPVLLAYRKVFALSAGAAAAYLFFVFLFFVFLCGAGFSFASLLVSVFPRTRLRDYALTVFALLFAG